MRREEETYGSREREQMGKDQSVGARNPKDELDKIHQRKLDST